MFDIKTQSWYLYLSPAERLLVDTSVQLLNQSAPEVYPDYSFVVFPMAKAYEGFLKSYFFDLGLISKQVYESHRFRIGRAFNPDVNMGQRDDLWIYDDVAHFCGEVTAREMWDAWTQCRNQVFHFFPLQHQPLSLLEAKRKIRKLAMAIDSAVHCQEQVKKQYN